MNQVAAPPCAVTFSHYLKCHLCGVPCGLASSHRVPLASPLELSISHAQWGDQELRSREREVRILFQSRGDAEGRTVSRLSQQEKNDTWESVWRHAV